MSPLRGAAAAVETAVEAVAVATTEEGAAVVATRRQEARR